ncbi:MAG: hypothetical protein IPI09_09895 [Burkholderiales bacterium]|nr:hypothetical protein [Burkholderiales bacterium]
MNQRTLLLSLALASTGLCSTAFAADTETLPSGVQIVHPWLARAVAPTQWTASGALPWHAG